MPLMKKVAAVELADGQVLTDIRVTNADQLRYGETAQRHKWPSMTVSTKTDSGSMPLLDYEDTFLAWAALRRLGLYDDTWEQFKDTDCLAVDIEDVAVVVPTQPVTEHSAADDSSSNWPTTSPATESSS